MLAVSIRSLQLVLRSEGLTPEEEPTAEAPQAATVHNEETAHVI